MIELQLFIIALLSRFSTFTKRASVLDLVDFKNTSLQLNDRYLLYFSKELSVRYPFVFDISFSSVKVVLKNKVESKFRSFRLKLVFPPQRTSPPNTKILSAHLFMHETAFFSHSLFLPLFIPYRMTKFSYKVLQLSLL